ARYVVGAASAPAKLARRHVEKRRRDVEDAIAILERPRFPAGGNPQEEPLIHRCEPYAPPCRDRILVTPFLWWLSPNRSSHARNSRCRNFFRILYFAYPRGMSDA